MGGQRRRSASRAVGRARDQEEPYIRGDGQANDAERPEVHADAEEGPVEHGAGGGTPACC